MNYRSVHRAAGAAIAGIVLASAASAAVNIETVLVGSPGNAADPLTGFGRVNYSYSIGKYEVTGGQYATFLNAVAATDTYSLYNTGMANMYYGSGISRSGSDGSYSYSVAAAFVNRPVNYVSFWDACRFANWLHNGQPTGGQGASTTETGAYNLTPEAIADNAVTRSGGAGWAVTSEDEWYKGAYYNPGTDSYFLYPTRHNTAPGQDMGDSSGNNANVYLRFNTDYPLCPGDLYTTICGEFQNSVSPFGTLDQAGNLFEWNELNEDAIRGVRGGSFGHYPEDARADAQYGDNAGVESYYYGFRVAIVPEPTSLLGFAAGLTGVLAWRKGRRRSRADA